ncbi:methyltransferase domain-containing protein [Candidatus Woesearchaeota archaeon]|nr:MAG: methyltransferase domain-containing protein [Candidatus Woesearchaeota archaeon]
MVYEPHEDSFLLKEFVHRYARGNVLDMGTGSGIQAIEASHRPATDLVIAIDIDPEALKVARKNSRFDKVKHKRIKWMLGDLFSPLSERKYRNFFDLIIFNAPYLPQSQKKRHIDLEGGRKGNEVIRRFLQKAARYLKPNGRILLVFSSLTPGVHEIIERNLFTERLLGKRRMFFEEIYVYELKRSPILNALERKGVEDISYFASGKRGRIFVGRYSGKKVAIKLKNPKSRAVGTISNEARMLKLVNKKGIGPEYLFHSSAFLVYKFVEGELFKDVLESGSKKRIVGVCKKVLDQAFKLDLLGVDKKEMTRPLKHVIVKGSKVTLIDFERARKLKKPHNVTQFAQCIATKVDRKRLSLWADLGKRYKKERSEAVLKEMKKQLDSI